MCTISVLAVFCTLPPFAGVGVISARGSLSLYGTCSGQQPSSGDLTSPPGDPRPGVHSMVHCSDCKPTSVQKGAGTCVSVTAIPMLPTSTLFTFCQIASQNSTTGPNSIPASDKLHNAFHSTLTQPYTLSFGPTKPSTAITRAVYTRQIRSRPAPHIVPSSICTLVVHPASDNLTSLPPHTCRR